jgi:hypothetical protein
MEAVARLARSGSGCETTAQPGRCGSWPRKARLPLSWHRHSRHDDAAVVEAIVPGHGLSGYGSAVGFPARSGSPMPFGSSSAAGDVGGSRITRAMQPSAVRGETSGPRPTRWPARLPARCPFGRESDGQPRLLPPAAPARGLLAGRGRSTLAVTPIGRFRF